MLNYILRRLLLMIPTLIGVTMVVFFIIALSPGGFGGAALNEMGSQMAGEEARRIRQEFMRRYGLDQPAIVQYGRWINQISPIGFRMSTELRLTDEQRDEAEAILRASGFEWREANMRNALNLIESIVFYANLPMEDVASQLAAAMNDPLSGLEMFSLVDATVDDEFHARLVDLQARAPRLAGDAFLDRLGYEALGRSRIVFTELHVKTPDLGRSLRGRSVYEMLSETLPITLLLNLITLPLIYAVAIVTGIYAARHRGKLIDVGSGVILMALWSIPTISAGVLAIGFLANAEFIRLFPTHGLVSLDAETMTFLPSFTESGWERGWLLDTVWHLILPVICLTYGGFAVLSKLMRGSVLDNLSLDYVRTARAKGVSDNDVLWRHVFRNSLLPLITVAANILPALLVGSVIVERIFSIQGMGNLTVESAFLKDREVIMATTLLASILTLGSQILRDVCYAIADPRVSYE